MLTTSLIVAAINKIKEGVTEIWSADGQDERSLPLA
jgi:hypothetical protein